MFSWSDVVATLGIISLAILAGYLKVLPEKIVVAMVTAALGYYAARTALLKKKSKADGGSPKKKKLPNKPAEDGAPERELDDQPSGVVEIAPQQSGRVTVRKDGSVVIGPSVDEEPTPEPRAFDSVDADRTPVDRRKPPVDAGDHGGEEE